MNQRNDPPVEPEQSSGEPAPFEKPAVETVKVYERPKRWSLLTRGPLPLWLILLLALLGFAASWFIFQALR